MRQKLFPLAHLVAETVLFSRPRRATFTACKSVAIRIGRSRKVALRMEGAFWISRQCALASRLGVVRMISGNVAPDRLFLDQRGKLRTIVFDIASSTRTIAPTPARTSCDRARRRCRVAPRSRRPPSHA
jgi:hypothetical protein